MLQGLQKRYVKIWLIRFSYFVGSSLLNSSEVSNYQLIVQVKDLGNQSLGYRALATVEITIVENTWIAPSPVLLQENLNVTYPKIISQVSEEGSLQKQETQDSSVCTALSTVSEKS